MKIERKLIVIGLVTLLISISVGNYIATRTFSSSNDDIYTKIICSNGNSYTASFTNFLVGLYSLNTTGGWIELPVCNLTVTKTINCPSNVVIKGAGKGNSILCAGALLNKDMMDITAKNWITIKDITFNLRNRSQTYGSSYHLIDMTGVTYNITIDNCEFLNGCQGGMVMADTDTGYITIKNCNFLQREYGIATYSGAVRLNEQHCMILNNRFKDTYTSCVYLEHDTDPHTVCGYSQVTGNYMTGKVDIGVCVEGWGTSDHPKGGFTVISDNVIEGLTGDSVYGAAYPRGISVINHCTVTGNIINGSRSGICVLCDADKYGFGVVISDNTITNIGTKYGINIEYAMRCIVNSNTISNGGLGSKGIQIYHAFNNTVTDNIVWGFPTGISEASSSDWNIINENNVNCTTDITHVGTNTIHEHNIGTVS
jgi:hypothetical protein